MSTTRFCNTWEVDSLQILVIGLLLIVAGAFYAYFSIERATLKQGRDIGRRLHVAPAIQVIGGAVSS